MADPAHVEIVKQGAEAIATWRKAHPDDKLDLSEAELAQIDLRKADLSESDMHKANLNESILSETDLSGANLREAKLHKANLTKSILDGADLRGADLDEAQLNDSSLIAAGMKEVRLTGAEMLNARLCRADLRGSALRMTNLRGADLCYAILSEANLHRANLSRAELRSANLYRANLREANLTDADLSWVNLKRADCEETIFSNATMPGVIGASTAKGLETTILLENHEKYFSSCERSVAERFLDWERLRTFGRLPLFGASYTVLILIPVFMFGLASMNRYVVPTLRSFASRVMETNAPDGSSDVVPVGIAVAESIQRYLEPIPIPSQSFLLLTSTLLLAVGSTIYVLFCPSRIKEFSRDQWCDQLGRSLLHYWPFAWKYRVLRFVCASCYALGGLGAMWVIMVKVYRAGLFIWENSSFSFI